MAAAHEESLSHLDNALSLWEGERSSRVADLVERRGLALRSLGRATEAIEALRSAARMAEGLGDLDRVASTGEALLWTLAWQHDAKAAIGEVSRLLTLLGDSLSVGRWRLLFAQALGHAFSGDVDVALRILDDARSIHRTVVDVALDRVAASVEAQIAYHLMQPGRGDELAMEAAR